MTDAAESEIKWAEHPQRRCRQPFTEDGLIDHCCDLPEHHPGPDAAFSSSASVARRKTWQAANPGWDKAIPFDDPFADAIEQLKREG